MIENEDQEFEGRAPVRTEGGEEKGKKRKNCEPVSPNLRPADCTHQVYGFIFLHSGERWRRRRRLHTHTPESCRGPYVVLKCREGIFFAEEYAHPSNLFLLSLALKKKKNYYVMHMYALLLLLRNATRRMGPPHIPAGEKAWRRPQPGICSHRRCTRKSWSATACFSHRWAKELGGYIGWLPELLNILRRFCGKFCGISAIVERGKKSQMQR